MSQMTKRALVASLKELMAEKPLDKITVTDLTEHCGVNRMTFYYHFKDIYDLVEWACVEEATRALAGQKTYDTWQQGFLQILQSLQKDKVFYINVYHSISREYIEQYLYKLTYDLITYASGKDAKYIVWIVKDAREEHRAAIEWLNKISDDTIGFFNPLFRRAILLENTNKPARRIFDGQFCGLVSISFWH